MLPIHKQMLLPVPVFALQECPHHDLLLLNPNHLLKYLIVEKEREVVVVGGQEKGDSGYWQ